MLSDRIRFDWQPPATDDTSDDMHFGMVQFSTSVEVTGELSPRATALTMCRLVCMYALSRMNEPALEKASQILVDIYSWQMAQNSFVALPGAGKTTLKAKPKIRSRSHVPFKIEEA